MKCFCRLGNGLLELPTLSQVQNELQTDGNSTLPLTKNSGSNQTLLPCFPVRSRNTQGLSHPGCLLKALCSGARGWTYWIRTRQGQEFALLRSSQRVSYVIPVLKPKLPYINSSLWSSGRQPGASLLLSINSSFPFPFSLFKVLRGEKETLLFGDNSQNREMMVW